MELAWIITAFAMLAIASILLACALWAHTRVLGRISHVERSLLLLVTKIEQLDERLTREVKQRAANARAENVEDERTIAEQAREHLAREGAVVVPLARPTRIRRRIS